MVEQNPTATSAKSPLGRPGGPLIPVILGLLVVFATAIFAFQTQSGVSNSRNWVLHTFDVRSDLQNLETQIAATRANALAFASTGEQHQLEEFRSHSESIVRLIENLRRLTSDNPRQQYRLGKLESLSKKYVAELEETVTATTPRVPARSTEASALKGLDTQQSQQEALVKSMQDDEQLLLDTRLARWNRYFVRNGLILVLALMVALLFLAYNFRLLNREITSTRELERIQRESVRSSRALSARILELQDSERRKVARELHDSVGQYLTGLKINLEQLLMTNPSMDSVSAKLLSDTVELADHTITEVRTISHLLHPPLLDELGLASAARWYAEGFAQRSGLRVNFQSGEIAIRLPKEVELSLFRVLQESLTNVHRHANAKSIDISLVCRDGRAILSIQDDGRGIPREVLSRFRSGLASGVGLAGMRERIAELEGVLDVEAKGRGTIVRAVIPLLECADERDIPQPSAVSPTVG
jgi:signal transduction histidine kinase